MKFIRVKEWTYEAYFVGTKNFYTEVDVTDFEALCHVRENTPEGRSGNVSASSLKRRSSRSKRRKFN